MHVNGKKMAVCGLTLAITEVLLILSGIFEFNTLFLLGAASFGVGIVIREFGPGLGAAFFTASVLLGFLLAPNKLYCVPYGAMALYILFIEVVHSRLGRLKGMGLRSRKMIFWVFKFGIFNLMYAPMLFLFPKLLFAKSPGRAFLVGALFAGQLVLVVYDLAYEYFQAVIWNRFRRRLLS